MAAKSSIPQALHDAVRRMASEGLGGPKIASRLLAEHSCKTTPRAVQRLLQGKAERAGKPVVPQTNGLTGRQVRFIEEYLLTMNATDAARKAGYSAKTATMAGSRLLRNDQVKKALDAAIENRAIRVAVKADDVLGELLSVARVDIGQAFQEDGQLKPLQQIPEEVRRAICGIEVEQLFEGRGEDRKPVGNLVKVKFWDKVRGLELLGKHLGLWEKGAGNKPKDDGVIVLPPECD